MIDESQTRLRSVTIAWLAQPQIRAFSIRFSGKARPAPSGGGAPPFLGGEAVAAVALQTCAKRRGVGLGQADDAQAIDGRTIDLSLMHADCRAVERGHIFVA